MDSDLARYVSTQISNNYTYLLKNVSAYADISYKYAKENYQNGLVNEIIAEVTTSKGTKDKILNKLVMEELNYGRKS